MPACIAHEDPATAVDRINVRLTADYVDQGWPEMGLPGYTIPAGTRAVLVRRRWRRSCTSGRWVPNRDGRDPGQINLAVKGRPRMAPAMFVRYERIDPSEEISSESSP